MARHVSSTGLSAAEKEEETGGGGVPHTDGFFDVKREASTYRLSYRIYNPSSMDGTDDSGGAPLLVLHGGPGLPSEYLYPLVRHIPSSRSVLFYDQLGCGKSSQPSDRSAYSISQSVDDLETFVDSMNLSRFHLLGHSYGGVLAYEYIKRICERIAERSPETKTSTEDSSFSKHADKKMKCLSVILSNSSTSMKLSDTEWDRLVQELMDQDDDTKTINERFRKQNQCRTSQMPSALESAIRHAGKIWVGTDVVSDYVATPLSSTAAQTLLPPTLLIRGEYDFVTELCTAGWKDLFRDGSGFREVLMSECAHYCHFEDGDRYGSVIEEFCSSQDKRE